MSFSAFEIGHSSSLIPAIETEIPDRRCESGEKGGGIFRYFVPIVPVRKGDNRPGIGLLLAQSGGYSEFRNPPE